MLQALSDFISNVTREEQLLGIGTTANHPYLVLSDEGKVYQENQQKSNKSQTKGDRRPSIDIENIEISSIHSHINFLKMNANAKDKIANKTSVVNIKNLFLPVSFVNASWTKVIYLNVKGLEIAQSGAITGRLYVAKTGASTTNVGGYFSASGATNNYGLIVDAGKAKIEGGDTGGDKDSDGVNSSTSEESIRPPSEVSLDAYDYLLCRIDSLLPQDEVLSLNVKWLNGYEKAILKT